MEINPFKRSSSMNQPGGAQRVPPGQTVTTKFPILHVGNVPTFDPATWDFRVFGEVEHPLRFTYDEFLRLPRVTSTSDFHCVTGWSRLDNVWEGVSLLHLLTLAGRKASAAYLIAHCEGNYTTNMPLAEVLRDDVLLAYRFDGEQLAPEHGWPLRLVVPPLYAYKAAKWVRALELSVNDKPGYWEVRGYSNHADPWKEERYSP